jgi:hypothetical protein
MDASLLTITTASGNFQFSAEDNNPMSSNVPNRPSNREMILQLSMNILPGNI